MKVGINGWVIPPLSCHSHSPQGACETTVLDRTLNIFSLIIFNFILPFLFLAHPCWRVSKWALTYDFVLIKLKPPFEKIETHIWRVKILLSQIFTAKDSVYVWISVCQQCVLYQFRYFVFHWMLFFFFLVVEYMLVGRKFPYRIWMAFSSFQNKDIVRILKKVHTVHLYYVVKWRLWNLVVMTSIFTISLIFLFTAL